MNRLHEFGGRCWCNKRHRVYTIPRRRYERKPVRQRKGSAYWPCYETAEQCDRETVAVCMMQMESDGEVRCVQTARGEAYELVECAAAPKSIGGQET